MRQCNYWGWNRLCCVFIPSMVVGGSLSMHSAHSFIFGLEYCKRGRKHARTCVNANNIINHDMKIITSQLFFHPSIVQQKRELLLWFIPCSWFLIPLLIVTVITKNLNRRLLWYMEEVWFLLITKKGRIAACRLMNHAMINKALRLVNHMLLKIENKMTQWFIGVRWFNIFLSQHIRVNDIGICNQHILIFPLI